MATSVSLFLSRARSTRGVSSPHPLFQRRFFSQLMAGPIIPLLSADPFDWIVLMKISEEQFHCSTGEWWRGLTIWMNAWKLGAETGQQNQDDWPWIHGDLIANSTVKTHTHTHTHDSQRSSIGPQWPRTARPQTLSRDPSEIAWPVTQTQELRVTWHYVVLFTK